VLRVYANLTIQQKSCIICSVYPRPLDISEHDRDVTELERLFTSSVGSEADGLLRARACVSQLRDAYTHQGQQLGEGMLRKIMEVSTELESNCDPSCCELISPALGSFKQSRTHNPCITKGSMDGSTGTFALERTGEPGKSPGLANR
jgi:hypothetical protein